MAATETPPDAATTSALPDDLHATPLGRLMVNPLYVYICAFVDELRRAGLRHVVVSPGSRSTPLALAFAAEPRIRTWVHVDERSAAFFALGLAKRGGAPVALVCTSGTAAANYLPAIAEARLSRVPLLALTADRPHDLRETGAPQAIDQNRLYGTHAKWFSDMAPPEATNDALRYARTLADRAYGLAAASPAGVVHLNFPLREPLIPELAPLPPEEARDPVAWYGRTDGAPYTRVVNGTTVHADEATLARVRDRIGQARRGLLIAGPGSDAASVADLASRAGYPVLADPLSGLRSDERHPHIVVAFDAFLRSATFVERVVPDLFIRVGRMPISKPLMQYMQRHADIPQIVLRAADADWEDPTHIVGEMLTASAGDLARLLPVAEEAPSPWLHLWRRADAATRATLAAHIEGFAEPFEGRVFPELADVLPEGSNLFAGNSMPIRDLDTFFYGTGRPLRIFGNRGANGIDGVTSTALGVAAAEGEPTVLVIGDLSFLHDLNGLLLAHQHRLSLVVVYVNNDGGGIFSFLPQAAYPEHFEALFGTPQSLDVEPAVRMYGGAFTRWSGWDTFRVAIRTGLAEGGLHVAEVRTDRARNVAMHRSLWQPVDETLRAAGIFDETATPE